MTRAVTGERPSARLLMLDEAGRLLLFRFEHRRGPLAGQAFWAMPGGALDPGETYAEAALRELREETGLVVEDVGSEVARREVVIQSPEGDWVRADERFFLVRARSDALSREGWTALEREIMSAHRWWTLEELEATRDQVWPEDLPAMVRQAQLR
jgi:8-oxo-dGTP pyrophosphatase MutT (NUDIX family)